MFFFFENRALYETARKNIVERGRPQMTIWRVRVACWITTTTNKHSEYVILIAFPQQQWLKKHVSLLRYTCISPLAFDSYNKQLFAYRTLPEQRDTIYFLRHRNSVIFCDYKKVIKNLKHYIKFVKLTLPGTKKNPAAEAIWTKKKESSGMFENAAK